MVEPKMSLTLILPGSTMVSQQVAENKPKEFTKENTVVLKYYKKNREGKQVIPIHFRTRISVPAKQVIQMSKEAYEAMLNEPTSPKYNKIVAKVKGKLIRAWDTMSEDARIKKHCALIAHDLKAIDFDYIVFED